MVEDSEEQIQHAAILLISMGEEHAARVLKHLGPKQVQRISMAMASLKNINTSTVLQTVYDFLNEVQDKTSIGFKKDEYIQSMLVDALGEEKASGIIDGIAIDSSEKNLETLKWLDSNKILELIRNEHPQIQSIILSFLDHGQAAEVLSQFSEKERLDLVMRIANLDTIQPAALKELDQLLNKQFSGANLKRASRVNGINIAAKIINSIDSEIESTLIEDIRESNEDLCQQIQDNMFVFENLLNIDDRAIQALLREITTETLVMALKVADQEIKNKIYTNMSKRASDLLKDDLEAKGPVKLSQVEEAQKEILTITRRMAEDGEIVIGGKGEEMV